MLRDQVVLDKAVKLSSFGKVDLSWKGRGPPCGCAEQAGKTNVVRAGTSLSHRKCLQLHFAKSIPAQIRQLILHHHSSSKNKLTNLCGNRLLQNNFINTFCEIHLCRRERACARRRDGRKKGARSHTWGDSRIRTRTALGSNRRSSPRSIGMGTSPMYA